MALRYATKIWLFSAIVSPVLIVTIETLLDGIHGGIQFFGVILLGQVFGALLSLPAYLLLFLLLKNARNRYHSELGIKKYTSLIVFVIWLLIFSVFEYSKSGFFLNEWFPYIFLLTLLLAVWFFDPNWNAKVNKELQADLLDDEETLH